MDDDDAPGMDHVTLRNGIILAVLMWLLLFGAIYWWFW